MADRFNLREAFKDKKKRSSILFIGFFVIVLLLLLAIPGGKKEGSKKAAFSTGEEQPTGTESELDRILAELKKEQEQKKKEAKPAPTVTTAVPAKNAVFASSPEFQKRQEKLQKEMMEFQLEKQEMELKIQRLQLQAQYLSAVAKLKGAKKRLDTLDAEKSKDVLVYDASAAAPPSGKEKSQYGATGEPLILGISEKVEILPGTFVDGIVQNRVVVNDGEVAPVVVIVDREIPDLYSREKKFLFPRGTKFIGETLAFSQSADRVILAFHTMLLPDGRSIPLTDKKDNLLSLNIKGMKGVASSVNRHFFSLLARSALVGLLQAGTMMFTPGAGYYMPGYGAGFVPYGAGGGVLNQNAPSMEKIAKDMALRNTLYQMAQGAQNAISSSIRQKTTITIKAGTRIKLFFAKKFVYEI